MAGRLLMWGIIIALFAYGGWQGYRALSPVSPRRGQKPHERYAKPEELDDEITDDSFDYAPLPGQEPKLRSAASVESGADLFQAELETQRMRRETSDLHAMLNAQQETIMQLKNELSTLREQRDKALEGQGMAPHYNEALLFARRGLSAEVIAERCDISVAEAALVKSMTIRGAGEGEA